MKYKKKLNKKLLQMYKYFQFNNLKYLQIFKFIYKN